MAKIGRDGAGRWAGLVGVAAAWIAAMAMPARGQAPARAGSEVYVESSHSADSLLRSAALHARDGQWAEAVEIYQRVLQEFGDKLASPPKDDEAADPTGESRLYVEVRDYCQRRLAGLPPEARAVYRARADSQAGRWFRQGVADRDRAPLRRVVEEAFCSSWGDDALDLLGDLAFQDGRFAEALACYRRLVPDRPGDPLGLTHPEPSVDLARVAAKKLLCRAALGQDPPGRADLEALAAAYPEAAGPFAGRRGPLAEVVGEALEADELALPAQLDGRWPTFAGSPSRTKIAPGSVDVGSFQWKVALNPQSSSAYRDTTSSRFRRGFMPTAPSYPDSPLAYHPIVLGDQVVVCDEKEVRAYNLNDRPAAGSPGGSVSVAWKHEHQPFAAQMAARQYGGTPRYTLTAHGDRIYARLGPPGPMMAQRLGGPVPSVIVAVDRGTDGKLLWKRAADQVPLPLRQADGRTAGFEGSPVADDRNVYVAMTEGGVQTATYVACLDAETGAPRWVRFICMAASGLDNGMGMGFIADLSHRLLTLDGSTVYYQTNLGALAALDAETGRMRWLATYPRQERNGGSAGRDLNPAIAHDGLVIIAPTDSSKIFAFDAVTGRLVWTSPPLPEVSHLLGVAKGRLVATGDHVWSLDARTGKVVRCWPDGGAGFEGFGRGLLAGDHIYWPTKTEIHILDQATGLRTDRPPIQLQELYQTGGGNLAVGDGYLVIAQPDALVVFCQNSRLIERYREEIARAPDQAANYFRLAQAAEATGQDDLALENLASAIDRARPAEMVDGQPLIETARDHRYRLLMKVAARAADGRDWDLAVRRFEEAAGTARADRDRLAARFRLADVQAERGDPGAAVATLQALLADDRLRPLSVAADEHRTVRADLLIADRLAALIRRRGRPLYAEFDRRADDLLERGKAEEDPRLLEEVGRSYPVARAVPAALLALGELSDALGRPSEAVHAYKRLLNIAPTDAERARALWGLARAYEAQRLWVPAQDAYLQVLSRFADQRLGESGDDAALGPLVAERLAREPFARMAGDRAEPNLALPLARRWGRRWEGAVRPIGAEGIPPSPEAGRIFLAERTVLRPVDPRSGAAAWSADLGDEPIWVGYLADRVLAATATRLVALRLDDGSEAWRFDHGAPRPDRRGPNPFARPEPAARRVDPPGPLHDFRIVGGRVFCQRGDRELLALDGDTGLVDWSYSPASGRLNRHASLGPRQVVLQVLEPHAVVVLETDHGRCLAEHPRGEDEAWAHDPLPIDDDHVALVVDRRTVALLDLKRGVYAWTFRESQVLPRNGPPRLLGDAGRLLVLYDGNELIRLDPSTGGRLWARPLGVEDLSDRAEAVALDGDRFYCVSGPTLLALALADGAPAWRRHLSGPEAGWALALTDRCVAVYPSPTRIPAEELDGLPLIFCRRDTGGLVQRLLFQASVSDLAVRLAPRGALVATQAGLWGLGDRPPLDGAPSP